jgi:hypothetical protein
MKTSSNRWSCSLLLCILFTFTGCGDPAATGGDAMRGDAPMHGRVHMRCGAPFSPVDQDIGPIEVFNAEGDAEVPPKVAAFLGALGWAEEHDDWHNIRRFDQICRDVDWKDVRDRDAPQCPRAQKLVDRGLWRAPIQEGAPGDGYAFLVMHRHMLQAMREAYPEHPELFSGFSHVPLKKDDPENPMPDREIVWSAAQLSAIDKLSHIEDHLTEFPTEDDLALYMEVPFRWTPEDPQSFQKDESRGIHTALHSQWSIPGSPIFLGNTKNDVNNRIFWKLHGWLDDIWQRYRVAKGISDEDPAYMDALMRHCEEMHALGMAVEAAAGHAEHGH